MNSVCVTILLAMLICNAAAYTAELPVTYAIPQLTGITVDGDPSDWEDKGFSVERISGSRVAMPPASDFDPSFKAGWNSEGLLILARVRDDKALESDDSQVLWRKDSIEMFVLKKWGSKDYYQVIVSPGIDPKHSELRYHVYDHRKTKPTKQVEVIAVSKKVDDGYLIEVLLPWKNLGIIPEKGVEIGFQFNADDADPPDGERFQATWYPSGMTWADQDKMYKLRLSQNASAPIRVSATDYSDFGSRTDRVDIVGPVSLAGKSVTVTLPAMKSRKGTFVKKDGRAQATLVFPPSAIKDLTAAQIVVSGIAKESIILLPSGLSDPKVGLASDFIVPTIGDFLNHLDLERPEFKEVRTALKKGDTDAAGKAYVAYFRGKKIASPLLTDWAGMKRDPKFDVSAGERILAGHWSDGYNTYDVPKAGPDWRDNPLGCIHRFGMLHTMRPAAHHTGKPKYVRWIVDHMFDSMKTYPIEEFVGTHTGLGWTGPEKPAAPWYWAMICHRLTEKSNAISLLRTYKEVTDDEILKILHRLYQEAAYQRTDIEGRVKGRHNAGSAMILGLARASIVLEDFQGTREWMTHAAKLSAEFTRNAFYPDGMFVELTVSYSSSQSLYQTQLAYAFRDQEATKELRPRLTAIVTAMTALSDPMGRLPSFGDGGGPILRRAIHIPIVDWLGLDWVKTVYHRVDGPKPPFTVWPVPGQDQWCGYYMMRSDWTPQARYMCIDGGPWGTNHQHGDKLSFILIANGATFIIDPRPSKYSSNQPDGFLSRQQSGFLHNTITVDGVDEFSAGNGDVEAKKPLTNTWEHGKNYSLFASSYSFKPVKPVKWERRMLFVNASYWLLQDVVSGDQKEAELEQNFQFDADIKISFKKDMTIAQAPNGARLVLIRLEGSLNPELTAGDKKPHTTYWPSGKPTTVLHEEDEKHGRGWTGGKNGWADTLIPAPAVTYVGKVTLPATLTMAIVPLAPGQTLQDVPIIGARKKKDQTIWSLPVKGAHLRFFSSIDECSVTE